VDPDGEDSFHDANDRLLPLMIQASITIDANRPAAATLHDAWVRRQLLSFLVWRDLKVRYKQTSLGIAWALIQPLASMAIFSLFFGRLAGVPSDGVPYPLFALAALVPWTYFASAVSQGSNALVASQALVSKVYFPRALIPLASAITPLVDAFIALALLAALAAGGGHLPGVRVLWLPAFMFLALMLTVGVCLFLSALNVVYRDVRYALPFLMQFWLFATPVVYPASLLPEPWRWMYAMNPMVSVIEGFRWSLLGTAALDWQMVTTSVTAAGVVLCFGIRYFRRLEVTFADCI
jgi:lipopolysaccharide transport system permease protein